MLEVDFSSEDRRELASAAVKAPMRGKRVGAVASAFRILRYLRDSKVPQTAVQITRALGLNPSTCFNILQTLMEDGSLEHDPFSRTYALGFGIVALAKSSLDKSHELRYLEPKIQQLAATRNVLAAVWRRMGDNRSLLVAAAESFEAVRIRTRLGARTPLLFGSTGRMFAAACGIPPSDMEARFAELRWARPLGFPTYLAQVQLAKQKGWALDDEYAHPGTVTISAPVLSGSDTPMFCCAAMLFKSQFSPKEIAAIAEELVEIGKGLQ